MSVDTPAKIAVVGAGPIGLEAALYARYLGYSVDVYESGRAAEHLHRLAHVKPFTPWELNTTSLGTAALRAQSDAWRPAPAGEFLTYGELLERYFQPLAQCDLLADCVQERSQVVAVGREGLLPADLFQDERRIDVPFRLLVREAAGRERIEHADVVLDCSGVWGSANPLGNGGMPAIGEAAAAPHIEYGLPDVAGTLRDRHAGRHTLVVGGGHSAATIVTALARLNADDPATRVTWLARRATADGALGPIAQVPDDPCPARDSLARRANLTAVQPGGPVEHVAGAHVEAIEYDGAADTFAVELGGSRPGHFTFDRVVAAVGHHADTRPLAALQLAPADVEGAWPSLPHPEPDFYILGAKSFGRRGDFLMRRGHEQIRALFSVIADRETLDLYAHHPAVSNG